MSSPLLYILMFFVMSFGMLKTSSASQLLELKTPLLEQKDSEIEHVVEQNKLLLKSKTPIHYFVIYNVLGQEVEKHLVKDTSYGLSLANLKKGTYIVRVQFKNDKSYNFKFVVK